jgi:hypothetical protein
MTSMTLDFAGTPDARRGYKAAERYRSSSYIMLGTTFSE